jgi:cytidyltransferase-like protein
MVQVNEKGKESRVAGVPGMSGLIIGKFMPPHQGHKYLVDFARNYCGKLTVMVCSIQQEPIEGKLRYEWMK